MNVGPVEDRAPQPGLVMRQKADAAAERRAHQRHGAAAAQPGAQRQVRDVPKQPPAGNIQLHQPVARADERARAVGANAQPAGLSRQLDELARPQRAGGERVDRRLNLLPLRGAHQQHPAAPEPRRKAGVEGVDGPLAHQLRRAEHICLIHGSARRQKPAPGCVQAQASGKDAGRGREDQFARGCQARMHAVRLGAELIDVAPAGRQAHGRKPRRGRHAARLPEAAAGQAHTFPPPGHAGQRAAGAYQMGLLQRAGHLGERGAPVRGLPYAELGIRDQQAHGTAPFPRILIKRYCHPMRKGGGCEKFGRKNGHGRRRE